MKYEGVFRMLGMSYFFTIVVVVSLKITHETILIFLQFSMFTMLQYKTIIKTH